MEYFPKILTLQADALPSIIDSYFFLFSDATMESAISYEKTVNEFFLTVKHVMRSNPGQGVAAFRKWGADEAALNGALRDAMDGVHDALCDNVDTR